MGRGSGKFYSVFMFIEFQFLGCWIYDSLFLSSRMLKRTAGAVKRNLKMLNRTAGAVKRNLKNRGADREVS